MASIDRHQYSEDIRKGAAKFVKDLNLDTKSSAAYIPRKSVNGDNGMFKKVSNNLSSKLEYFQKLDKEAVSSSLPRRSSAGSALSLSSNLIKNTSLVNGGVDKTADLNGSLPLLSKTNGISQEVNGGDRLKNRSSIGAIANFALGEPNNVEAKLASKGLEAQVTFSKPKTDQTTTKVTPLSRLPGQDLNIGDLNNVTNGLHTAQVALITNNSNGLHQASAINGVVFSRQSSVEKVNICSLYISKINFLRTS